MIDDEQNNQTDETDLRSASAAAPDETEAGWRLLRDGEILAVFAMVLVLLVGAIFRFTGLNWDDGHHLHPDERFLTTVASRLSSPDDPLAYLRDVFTRLPTTPEDRIEPLLPDHWIAEHPQHRLTLREKTRAERKRTSRATRRKALKRASRK